MNITVIGAGHVGLVTGCCLAELDNNVVFVDNDRQKIDPLKRGRVPFYEPGLEALLNTHLQEGRISFTESIAEGIKDTEIIFIIVGTPPTPEGKADLSAIEKVSLEVAENLKDYKLVVEKSTVPVRTGEWIEKIIRENVEEGVDFDVASNPEFLREGSAVYDFMHPDRVVIGVNSERAASLLVKLYSPLNAALLITDIASAELIKHSSNAFLAMKISFINAIANVCERAGADVTKVAKGVGLDKRIGEAFLEAGVGYGGSCFPKDVSAFIYIAEALGYDFRLLKEVKRINAEQQENMVKKLSNLLGDLRGKTVGVLGLSYKPNTDDTRESPALKVIDKLLEKGARVKAYDPVVKDPEVEIEICDNPYGVTKDAEALLILTEWDEFKYLELRKIRFLMRRPIILDGRNILDPNRLKAMGFIYEGMGRRRSENVGTGQSQFSSDEKRYNLPSTVTPSKSDGSDPRRTTPAPISLRM